jgi:hypothetical protein
MTFLVNAAKYYNAEPHQIAAWEELEVKLPKYLLEEFQAAYRAKQDSPVSPTVTNSWEGIYTAAAMAGSKFPAVTAAQWALESAYGKYVSGKNNFFGIKGPGTSKTTWEDYGNGPVTIVAQFRDFSTPEECVQYLVDRWYRDYKGYRGVNRANSNAECARLLKVEGYATDPAYTQKLINIISQNL